MTNLHTIGDEIHNFGPLQDPDEHGNIRVVHAPHGDEIQWILSPAGVL
jgi:hypothetical protein